MQAATPPLVSVIIPFLNRERYLGEAIDSILADTHRPIQIIAVDNGSTDRSAAIVQAYPEVDYLQQPERGIARALNTGLAAVEGEYIAFLDSDDLWCGDKLTSQLEALQQAPELDLVFGHLTQFICPLVKVAEDYTLPTKALKGMVRGTLLARNEAFDRVGGFDTSLRAGEFIDWFIRAIEAGLNHVVQPDVYLKRRVHDTNFGIEERDSQRDFLRILKASLDRRRQKSASQ